MNEDYIKKINNEINELESNIFKTNIIDGQIISSSPNGMEVYDLKDDGTGKKYDGGKSMVGTAFKIFANSLLGIGACVEFGTHKYPKSDNWKLVEDGINRYTNSLMRHLAKHFSGQERDPETGLPHLFHAGWNMLAIIEFYLMEHPDIVKEIQR